MAVLGTITLLFQALLLAHGGLTTLGANVFSMAVVGPWAGYGIYRLLRRYDVPLMSAVFAGAFVADLSTYCVTSVQLALAFPDPGSGFLGGLGKFGSVFAVTQIPVPPRGHARALWRARFTCRGRAGGSAACGDPQPG